MDNEIFSAHFHTVKTRKMGIDLDMQRADESFEITVKFSIEFSKWCGSNSWSYNSSEDLWAYYDTTGRYNETTEEMFKIFLSTKKSK